MNGRRAAGGAAALAVVLLVAISAASCASLVAAQPSAPSRRIAWRVVETSSGRILDTHDAELLSRPVLPGSLIKLPALIASLEGDAITPATRFECPASVVAGGRRIGCQHARRAQPLSAVEAFALSCNVFFARVSDRLSRDALNGVLASFGWPSVPAQRTLAMAATGIEGTAVPPDALLAGFRQLLLDPPGVSMRSPTRKVVREALAAAADGGTAAAFRDGGVDALAKTGTSGTTEGRPLGLLLAAWPADRPTRAAIILVEGGSGPDAAAVGAALARGERPVLAAPPVATAPPLRTPPAAPPAPAVSPPATVGRSGTPPPPPAVGDLAGALTIRVGTPRRRGAYAVRRLPVEQYVARVLAGEAAARTAPAGLEALAVAARTFAFANRRRHARDGFDLCDSTHCQVLREPYPAARAASDATAGQVLAWQGAPASIFYTASCGGRTERPSAVWPGAEDPPYLPSRRDRGCGGQPQWSATISEADLQRALAASGYRGARLRKVKVRDRADSGRVAVLSLEGLTPGAISGQNFRMVIARALGPQVIKSTAFELSHRRGVYTFKGHGYGHGVGLCVIGSMRRAADGESRTSLLNAYFPGLQVADYRTLRLRADRVAPPEDSAPPLASGEETSVVDASRPSPPGGRSSLTLQLPDADAKERASLEGLLERALARASARTGRAAPAAVTVVVHPSAESFRHATDQPWWADAFARGHRVDVQPLSLLRQRGVLEQALAHTLARTVISAAVAGRPAWVQEGAAMYAAGLIDPIAAAAVPLDRRVRRCPSDDELRHAPSAAGARIAHARARDCFARALRAGKRWEDIR